ncbi:MAG: hypothetical protein HY242_09130 [Afipia sp.]|nr:hypothetical protein [Afipia sp.]
MNKITHEPLVEPPEKIKLQVREAAALRGNIVGAFSHIEYLLADVCMRAWLRPEYRHLADSFPYKVESRIRSVRTLFSAEGPLKKYEATVDPLLDELLKFEELRHFMAHGWAQGDIKKNEITISYRLYIIAKGGSPTSETKTFSLRELQEIADDLNKYSANILGLFYRIYLDEKLQ